MGRQDGKRKKKNKGTTEKEKEKEEKEEKQDVKSPGNLLPRSKPLQDARHRLTPSSPAYKSLTRTDAARPKY